MKGILSKQGDRMIVTELPTMVEPDNPRGDAAVWDKNDFLKAHAKWREHIRNLRSFEAIGFTSSSIGKEVEYELRIKCPQCGGDGKETCNNPDHGLIDAIGGETGRLGCPGCGHDPNHKTAAGRKGAPCFICDGSGCITDAQFEEYCGDVSYDEEAEYVAIPAPIGKPGESEKFPSILSIALKSIAALSDCEGSRNVAKEALQKYASQSQQTGTQGDGEIGIILKFIDETIDNYKKQIGPSYSQPYFFTKLKEMISEFSPQPSPVREEAVGFAEWVGRQGYEYHNSPSGWFWIKGNHDPNIKTTSELYQLYLLNKLP